MRDVTSVDDSCAIREEEVVDDAGPQAVGEPKVAAMLLRECQHIAQGLRGENSLPHRQKIPETLEKASQQAFWIRGDTRLWFGPRPGAGDRLRAAALEPDDVVPLGDGKEGTCRAANDLAERRRAGRGREAPGPEGRLADREAFGDHGGGHPEFNAVAREVGRPDILLEEQ